MGHPSPKYTAEFKQRAVELYRERGCTYAELARELGWVIRGAPGRGREARGRRHGRSRQVEHSRYPHLLRSRWVRGTGSHISASRDAIAAAVSASPPRARRRSIDCGGYWEVTMTGSIAL